ncbi:hypothetical protein BKA61DRAFT_616037 [Leptodontidium sp. MPI-SDFR-AT-0119]|nr:hypothetical protein BKA61DRAFT_616037 [Leptodontidium sp. MPI-SDFR-AT-0119]
MISQQTRIAFDSSIEQQCRKCHNWKPYQYQAKKKNRSGLTREQDDNAESVTSSTIVVDAGMGGNIVMGEAEPEAVGPSKKRKTSYAQKTPRRKSPTLGLNPYAPIGQSQETPHQIAARRERAAIQRGHRTIARASGSPSPTPNMSQLVAGHIPGPPPMPSTYFICDICSLPRPVTVQSAASGVCVYCQQPSQASITMELMWCVVGEHVRSPAQLHPPAASILPASCL